MSTFELTVEGDVVADLLEQVLDLPAGEGPQKAVNLYGVAVLLRRLTEVELGNFGIQTADHAKMTAMFEKMAAKIIEMVPEEEEEDDG